MSYGVPSYTSLATYSQPYTSYGQGQSSKAGHNNSAGQSTNDINTTVKQVTFKLTCTVQTNANGTVLLTLNPIWTVQAPTGATHDF